MKKLTEGLRRYGADLVLLAGGAAVAVGAGMLSLPWGFITGGALLMAAAVLSSLGGGDR